MMWKVTNDNFRRKKTMKNNKHVLIEYLYLDLNTCDRCMSADEVLEDAIDSIKPALEAAGYTVSYEKKEMTSRADAQKYRFLSSPTIRVNGTDICDSVSESDCQCCGDISGTQVDCRTFEYEGVQYEVPPKAMLVEKILEKTFSQKTACCEGEYVLPENLERFYAGKEKKSSCCCSSGCCC